VPRAGGLTAANTARDPSQSHRAIRPAPLSPAPPCPQPWLPTLLSGQQRHVHVLGGMQERGGSGLRTAGGRLLCRGFEGALDGAADTQAVLGTEEDIDGALSASHGDLESLGKGKGRGVRGGATMPGEPGLGFALQTWGAERGPRSPRLGPRPAAGSQGGL